MASVSTIQTDTKRLEALFENGWSVYRFQGRYRIEGGKPITEFMDDPRDALDEAMRLDALFAKSHLSLEENLLARELEPAAEHFYRDCSCCDGSVSVTEAPTICPHCGAQNPLGEKPC